MDEHAEVEGLDAWARARRIGEMITSHQEAVEGLSRLRREAIDELLSQGNKQTAIAEYLGLTRARLSKLLTSGPKPERAFLGTGPLTVAVGGKPEVNGQKGSSTTAVISAESLNAYHVIRDLASSYELETQYELVPPPGLLLDLTRPNLVVMTSPRLLPLVGQVLKSDPNLAFESGPRGWYLRDQNTNEIYRSPSDDDESADYAYVGRLPRLDGKGTFLYLAGIHAMGTLGAARFLADNIEELYREVKTRRWSTLVSCRYDPDTREIQATDRLTPIYTA